MFTTQTAKLAAQRQTGMFDEPEAADLFALAPAQPESPAVVKATAHGARFEQRGTEWFALAHRRGRAVALASFASPTQDGAAGLYLAYFNLKA